MIRAFRNIFFITFILFPTLNIYAQLDDSLFYRNADYQVAREIFTKKIIMLEDYGHDQPGPYHRLINTLYNWLILSSVKQERLNLTLILESDERMANNLNNFFWTGNIRSLTDSVIGEFFLENLEFFTNLRNFSKRIDSVNMNRVNKIHFKVKGFEKVGLSDIENIFKKNQRDIELWFVNERDSITAAGIINYKNSNPDEMLLIYYGGFHLNDCFMNKKEGGQLELPYDECYGFCLAHFLKKEFGNDNVVTIGHRMYPGGIFSSPEIGTTKDTNIIFKSKYLSESQKECVDYIISCMDIYVPITNSNYICSRYIIEKITNNIKIMNNYLPGYKAMIEINNYLNALKNLIGKGFHSPDELDDYLNNHTYDAIDWLYSNKLEDTISAFFKRYKNLDIKNLINSVLKIYGVPFYVSVSDVQSFEKLNEWFRTIWFSHIKFTNSIGIYWLGYPDEKLRAKEYLIQFSGQNYDEPEKYLQWYRKNIVGVDYENIK